MLGQHVFGGDGIVGRIGIQVELRLRIGKGSGSVAIVSLALWRCSGIVHLLAILCFLNRILLLFFQRLSLQVVLYLLQILHLCD